MKVLITISFIFVLISGMCQEPLSYTEVVSVSDSANKEMLFERLDYWFATKFVDSKEVIQSKDKKVGKIIGNAAFLFESPIFIGSAVESGYVKYNISVFVKDGRYKYVLANYIHEGTDCYTNGRLNKGDNFGIITSAKELQTKHDTKVWNAIKISIYDNNRPLIKSLKEAMEKTTVQEDADW